MSFFPQFITFLYICLHIHYFCNANENCDKIRTSGTGTVLFNPTDAYKTCWSQEEIAILTARIIFEDIIPDQKLMSIQCNEDVEDLVDYFKVIIEAVRSNTKARKRHIMLLALTDLLGGYLHHALLPMARKAFYAGALDYEYMEKLIQLYEELKWFLRTNGQGWTKPLVIHREVKVPIIEMNSSLNKNQNETCHKLMFYEHEPLRTRKRSANVEKGIYFPLPFFDAKVKPTAIALPLKHYALRNIESKRAAYAVMRYFITAEQCLKEKNAKADMVAKFQNNLYTWIERDVVPKLDDDKFYAAFGGILRVRDTLKALGASLGNRPCNTDEGEEEVGAIPGLGCSARRNKLFLIAMLIIIVAWFLIGTCFICYRMKNNRSNPKNDASFEDRGSKKSKSTSSYSSSKWSSLMSRSSSKTDKVCKCCESTISERSTVGYTSTNSEYDSEKSRRKDRRAMQKFKGKKATQSSPCVCSSSDGPAVIDANHSMKVLPSIAEMSENSMRRGRNGSFRKISFADESGVSSSDGGVKICAPPWAQAEGTVPCPVLSEKSTNYSTSTTAKSHLFSDPPLASSSRTETPPSMVQQHESIKPQPRSYKELEDPLANSTFKQENTEMIGYNTSSSIPEKSSNNSVDKKVSIRGNVEEYRYADDDDGEEEEEKRPRIKEEVKEEAEEKSSYYNYHMGACHSSVSGNYDLYHKPDPNKPYIFGYDFQTSTSSELSDDDDDSKY